LIGQQILHYEITTKLGAGGMGEVYRATDTRLNREVAIKVLPTAFVQDTERLARFEREAKVLASLNHANIAAIYALESVGEGLAPPQEGTSPSPTDGDENVGAPLVGAQSVNFLVMELVDGQDLSEHLAGGSIPADEALKIAHQIALALQAAHAQSIVHRDLKPANIKITPDGQVKVLDFGLAKAWDRPASSDLTRSPTLTAQMTQAGAILGTASYMSPEQARAQDVDKRADIWSFGVVFFEMLAGGRIFSGDTVTDILGAIVHKAPDWDRLPPNLPSSIRRLLHRCLEKDLDKRLQDIGDARIEIEEVLEGGPASEADQTPEAKQPTPRWLPWAVATAALALAAWSLLDRPAPVTEPAERAQIDRLTLLLPETQRIHYQGQSVAISPDGRTVAYCANSEHVNRIHVRPLDRLDSVPLEGTEGCSMVFFSPDGQAIAFFQGAQLFKVPLSGGAPMRISGGGGYPVGASWADDDSIVFVGAWGTSMSRVPTGGGEPEYLTSLDPEAGGDAHLWPEALPGSKTALYTVWSAAHGGQTAIHAYSFGSGNSRMLLENARSPRYSETGHLLFMRGDQLMAVGFDPDAVETVGSPSPLATDVRLYSNSYGATFDVSDEGTLVYQGGGTWEQKRRIAGVDRNGNVVPAVEDERDFTGPAISSDGSRVVVTVRGSVFTIWIYDFAAATRTKLQQDADNGAAVWLPGGKEIVYWSNLDGPYAVYRKNVDGSSQPELVSRPPIGDVSTIDVSPDGRTLVYENRSSRRPTVLAHVDLHSGGEPAIFLDDESNRSSPAFSPDSRWLAFVSDESGQPEVHVAAFPGPGPNWMISSGGGSLPKWSPDGRELYYVQDDQFFAVEVELDEQLRLGKSEALFESDRLLDSYSVAPDGRFLMLERVEDEGAERHQLNIVLNWPAALP